MVCEEMVGGMASAAHLGAGWFIPTPARYELVHTPSRLAGVPADLESNLRVRGCELIQSCGILLRCSQVPAKCS